MINLTVTDEEHATILAALRAYQRLLEDERPRLSMFHDIATNGGTVTPLDANQIDTLCERINT
jgi:hypothetical protein